MELTYINVGSVALALFLALVNNRLVEYFAVPLFERFSWDKGLLLYVSALTGFVLAILANADLFAPGLFDPLASKIISAIVIAGGSNLIHDLTKPGQTMIFRKVKPTTEVEKVQL